MLALVCVPAFVQLLLQSWLLESPRWYVMAGMEVPAEDILMQLRDTPIDDPQLQEELFCMVETCAPAKGFISHCLLLPLSATAELHFYYIIWFYDFMFLIILIV
ncbi:hypothetical protein T492DRAFT_849120 [Pavlovales sp. CCMP2436]|nr:hypothetical protein T492DRAFT_849120 [Pavlovales sp. CCMP2436]